MTKAEVRYGAKLRKMYEEVQSRKRTRYECPICGKKKVKRIAAGIWQCENCGTKFTGGAYSFDWIGEV